MPNKRQKEVLSKTRARQEARQSNLDEVERNLKPEEGRDEEIKEKE
jgi:hypothetical protein